MAPSYPLRLVTKLSIISGIREVAQNYDAMLCDAWGVVHDGVNLFPGAADAMIEFRNTRGPLIILTNAPRPSSIIPGQLDRLGLPRAAYDGVVTSGDATRAEIEARLPAPAYRIGPEKDDPLFEDMAIDFVSMDKAGFVICTGLADDQNDAPEDYRAVLSEAAARNLTMVCANPDIVVNWGGRIIWCAGAVAQIYEQLGGEVVYGGKPHAPIYRIGLAAIENAQGSAIDMSRVLAVGDGLATDIEGANRHAIDALLVAGAGGIHNGAADAASISARLDEANVHAIAAAESLTW